MALFKRKTKKDDSKQENKEEKSVEEKDSKKSMKDLYKGEEKDVKTGGEKKSTEKQAPSKGKAESKKKYIDAYKVLVRPIVTEKVSDMGEQNKYAFEVSTSTNKVEVSKAIEGVYGVKPQKVNIIKMKGKRVRLGMTRGRRKDWKKAMITLPKGETINVYDT